MTDISFVAVHYDGRTTSWPAGVGPIVQLEIRLPNGTTLVITERSNDVMHLGGTLRDGQSILDLTLRRGPSMESCL